MAIVKIREVVGTSPTSFEDALRQIIEREIKAGKKVSGAHVINQTVDVQDGKINEFRVDAKIAYRWEEE